MSEDVPRDPSYYHPTRHAGQQRKDRGIEWDWVAETIENGGIKHSRDNTAIFEYNIHGEGNVRVVVDYEDAEVVTITWRTRGEESKHTNLQ